MIARTLYCARMRRALDALVVVLIIALYIAPQVASTMEMRPSTLPPQLTPDLYLHLNFAVMDRHGASLANPWYHTPVAATSLPYVAFARILGLFGWFARMIGNLPMAVLLWNGMLTLALCLVARSLLRSVGFERTALPLAVVMLVDIWYLQAGAATLLHGRFTALQLSLPFLRPFFPQFGALILLAYLMVQIQAARKPSWKPLAVMCLLQFAMVTSFPYGVFLLAGASAPLIRRRGFAVYAVACAIVDLCYVMAFPLPLSPSVPGIDAGQIVRVLARPSMLVLIVLIALTFRRVRDRSVALTIVGAASSVAIAYFFDAFLNGATPITHHILYLMHPMIALMIVVVASTWPLPSLVTAACAIGVATMGVAGSISPYLRARLENTTRAAAARAIAGAGPHDLVVAPADMFRDEGIWVPLASPAEVLLTRGGTLALSHPGDDAPRVATQLRLGGITPAAVHAQLTAPRTTLDQVFLAGFSRQTLLNGSKRGALLAQLERELVTATPLSLRRYERVYVIDDDSQHSFPRASELIAFDRRVVAGEWVVRSGVPR